MLFGNNFRRLMTTFSLLIVFCAIAYGQSAEVAGANQIVDARTKDQLKVIMAHLLETIYVSPEIGKQFAKQLQVKFESDAYKEITTPAQLAEALTRDLRELGKDKHLYVRYNPAAAANDSILTLPEWEKMKPTMFSRQTAVPRPNAPEMDSRLANQLRESNYNFREAKYLDGNIGYLEMGGFAPGAAAREAAAKTMATLANSEAMIIDLRRCPGGNAEMVNFLASYFFDKEPRVLMTRYIRPTDETVQSKTVADIPGKRMIETDLYILVSSKTASACESFPYTLQQYGRAKIVGERTAGAGYNNVLVPLGKGFSFSVSFGRPVHPRSGKGWEGEGVQADIAVNENNALETAHKEALQKLIGKTTEESRKKELQSALQNLAVKSNATASAPKLQDYVGTYGNKEISVRDGGLYYQRIGGRGAALRATEKDKFALNSDAQIIFARDASGTVTEMLIEWADRPKEQLKREVAAETKPQNQPPAENATNRVLPDDSAMAKELAAFLDKLAAADSFSGVVLVARNGQPVFKKAYGLANKTANAPNNTETKFNIASMNKMFTAVSVAQLAEKGKLSFDDTISKHLPDYPNKAVADKVTIHQLLTHTSGMGNYQNEKFFVQLDKMKSVSDLLPLFASEPLAFEPGAKWQYSNAGFAVLGLIIEKVSGQNYFDYVRENVFKPAGMNDTDSYEKGANVKNRAVGYTRMNVGGQPDPNAPRRENTQMLPAKGSSAGGGYSTVEDLLKFAVALQNHKLLSKKFTDIVRTGKFDVGGPVGKYAYGFGDKNFNGKHIVGHNGGSVGIGANFDVFPELGYTAIILTNYDPPAMMPVIMRIRELIPAASPSVSQQTQKLQDEKTLSQAEQEVRKLEREWLDAYEKRDAEAMNRIVADDFKLTFSDGRVQTKADILAQLKSEKDSGRPSPKLSTEDVQSRVENDTVILTGRFIQRMERDGQTRMMQMRYTDTYSKRQGRWQVVASQLTRIESQ